MSIVGVGCRKVKPMWSKVGFDEEWALSGRNIWRGICYYVMVLRAVRVPRGGWYVCSIVWWWWELKIINIIVCMERLTIDSQIAYGFRWWKCSNIWKWCIVYGVVYFRHTVREWFTLSDRVIIGGSVANMFSRKDVSWIIERNFIFIGFVCRDIGMYRFGFISCFVFNAGFVQVGGVVVSCRAISVSRVGRWFAGVDRAFKRGIGTGGVKEGERDGELCLG